MELREELTPCQPNGEATSTVHQQNLLFTIRDAQYYQARKVWGILAECLLFPAENNKFRP